MQEIKIYLKSGQVVKLIVKDFAAQRNGLGELIKVEWIPLNGHEMPLYIDLSQVACITGKEIGSNA